MLFFQRIGRWIALEGHLVHQRNISAICIENEVEDTHRRENDDQKEETHKPRSRRCLLKENVRDASLAWFCLHTGWTITKDVQKIHNLKRNFRERPAETSHQSHNFFTQVIWELLISPQLNRSAALSALPGRVPSLLSARSCPQEERQQPQEDFPAKAVELRSYRELQISVDAAKRQTSSVIARAWLQNGDTEEATKWYATNETSGKDMFNTAVMYHTGKHGVSGDPNLTMAVQYYSKASSLGHGKAKYNLGLIFLNRNAEDKREVGIELIREAAALNVKPAKDFLKKSLHKSMSASDILKNGLSPALTENPTKCGAEILIPGTYASIRNGLTTESLSGDVR